MAHYECGINHSKKWYRRQIFPLVPIIETREADEYNTYRFSFKWLFITIWSLDSFEFEITAVVDDHWGIGFIGILPYIRWVFTIPCPVKLGMWMQKNLWRKPKQPK